MVCGKCITADRPAPFALARPRDSLDLGERYHGEFNQPRDFLCTFHVQGKIGSRLKVKIGLCRAAFETAKRLHPKDRIDYRCGARVIERSYEDAPR